MEDSKKPKSKRVKRQDNPIEENVDAVIQLTGGVLQSLFSAKLEGKILKTIHRLRLLSGKYDREAANHFRTIEEKSRFQELQESWSKLNRQLSRRAENMRRRTKSLKYIGGKVMSLGKS